MADDTIPLSVLPRELARLTGAEPPPYRRCYQLALDARLPTELVSGRHRVSRADLPAIAKMLGLTPLADCASVKAPRSRAAVATSL